MLVHSGKDGIDLFLVYVDDCLLFAKDTKMIDMMIATLSTDFELEPKDDVTAFLGIEFRKHDSGTLEMNQPH